jgi:hypothetical protein
VSLFPELGVRLASPMMSEGVEEANGDDAPAETPAETPEDDDDSGYGTR